MIYTVTFNPAIDYVMSLENLNEGAVNRSKREQLFFGGKGINVSRVLNELGITSVATGFIAGFTGKAIEDGLCKMGIKTDFVQLEKGNSRINVKLKGRAETDINGNGPDIQSADLECLSKKLEGMTKGDTLVLAGGIPCGLPPSTYGKILEKLVGRGMRFVVDAEGKLLTDCLKFKPFLVKPNTFELEEICGRKLGNKEEIIRGAKLLQEKGAMNVFVSMANDGAILIDEYGQVHFAEAPKGTAINSVGAGDSAVAGFLAGYTKTCDYAYALKMGVTAGSATAFSEDLATGDKIKELFEKR